MTANISKSAKNTKPMVPANESNSFNQYSPAPVQNNNPTTQQIRQTKPEKQKTKINDLIWRRQEKKQKKNFHYAVSRSSLSKLVEIKMLKDLE